MNFISEDFHLHYISNYTLRIQSDYINDYLVVTNNENEVLVFMHYDSDQPSPDVLKFLSFPFTNVLISLPHQNLIWVPAELFTEEDKKLYSTYFLDDNVDNILTKEIDNLGVVALYQYDVMLKNRWSKVFPEAKFIPSFTTFIHNVKDYALVHNEFIALHKGDEQVDLFLVVNGEFKLYNTFEVATIDDLQFFILSVLKNFSLSEKVDKILITGIDVENTWVDKLKVYAQEVTHWKSNFVIEGSENQGVLGLNVLSEGEICE